MVSEFKQILDDNNISLYEFVINNGMKCSYTVLNRAYNNPNFRIADLSFSTMLALSNDLGLTIDELLNSYYTSGIYSEIQVLKSQKDFLKRRLHTNYKPFLDEELLSIDGNDTVLKVTYDAQKLSDSPNANVVLTSVPQVPGSTKDAPWANSVLDDEIRLLNCVQTGENIPARTHITHIGNTDATHHADGSSEEKSSTSEQPLQNIPAHARTHSDTTTTDCETSPGESANAENIAYTTHTSTFKTSPATTDGNTTPYTVYQNVEVANKTLSKYYRIMREYEEAPEKLGRRDFKNARFKITPIADKFLNKCMGAIEYIDGSSDEKEEGTLNVYYSFFNIKGEFLFSEIYTGHFVESEDEKHIEYFHKVFFDLVQEGMAVDFTDEDKITKEEFYNGIYRMYRVFKLQM